MLHVVTVHFGIPIIRVHVQCPSRKPRPKYTWSYVLGRSAEGVWRQARTAATGAGREGATILAGGVGQG